MKRIMIFLITLCIVLSINFLIEETVFSQEQSMLRYTQAFPTNIDPAVGSDFSSTRALTVIYDTLVYPDENGEPLPHVATNWEVSDDGKTWTFYLREDVIFHDGSNLTAEDIKFSMDRLMTIGEGWAFLFVDKVKSAEVIDEYTIQINLTEPFGPFLPLLYRFYILNKDLVMENFKDGEYGEFGDYGRDYLLYQDAGSGPYMVEEFPRAEHLKMVKFQDYWGYMAPKSPDILMQIGTTEPITVRTMMNRRELEISDQWQSPESLTALERIEGIEIAYINLGGVFHYMIHNRKPPTDCVHFRRAILWAMDYNTLIEYIYPGYNQARGPVSSTIAGHDPNVFQFQYDMDKAREEIEKSKYFEELREHPLEIYWVSEVPIQERIALLLQSNLVELGVDARVVRAPWLNFVDFMTDQEASPHLVPMFLPSSFPEAGAMLFDRYHSASVRDTKQNEWLMDPEYDSMIEKALSILDFDERMEKYSELQHYIVELAPTLFLLDDAVRHAFQEVYIDWPSARGEGIPVSGYEFDARWIEVHWDMKPR